MVHYIKGERFSFYFGKTKYEKSNDEHCYCYQTFLSMRNTKDDSKEQ